MKRAPQHGPPLVAVVDSGWNRRVHHGRVVHGRGFARNGDGAMTVNNDDADRTGHGSSIARVILAVAESAVILPIRVFSTNLETDHDTLTAALTWLTEYPPNVVNLSLSSSDLLRAERTVRQCLRLQERGTFVVAALANEGVLSLPAEFDGVIAVAAQGNVASTRADVSVPTTIIRSVLERHRLPLPPSNSYATAVCSAALANAISNDRTRAQAAPLTAIAHELERLNEYPGR